MQVGFTVELHLHNLLLDDHAAVTMSAKGRLLNCVHALAAINGTSAAAEPAIAWTSKALEAVSDADPRSMMVHRTLARAHAAMQPTCEPGVTLSETMQVATSTLASDLDLLVNGVPTYDDLAARSFLSVF